MSNFNFGDLQNKSLTTSVQRRLTPYEIHKVVLAKAYKDTVQGVKDPSMSYDILKLRFENENGFYEEPIFYLKDGDDQRQVYTNRDGHDSQMPSNFERTMALIAQVGNVLNPEGFKKLQELSPKFKDFDQLVQAFIKILEKPIADKKETNLKLVGRTKDGYVNAALPRFVAVNKNGDAFVSDNFIGENLTFSAYEIGKRNEYLNAKPTTMSTTEPEDNSGIDIASLLD